MSLLSPERFRIGLGASYAALAEVKGGRLSGWRMQTWQPGSPADWQAPFAAVSGWLRELAPAGAKASLTLSAEIAPMQLLPWRDDATGAEQQSLLAAARFRSIYGESLGQSRIIVETSGYSRPWLASATQEALLAAIPQSWGAAGVRLNHVTPLALSWFNRQRKHLKSNAGWLIVFEPQLLTALHWREGHPCLLQNLPLGAVRGEPLTDLLLRETRLAGLPDLKTAIHAVGMPITSPGSSVLRIDPDWTIEAGIDPSAPLHLLGSRP